MRVLTKLEENVLLTILKLKDDAYIVSIKDQIERFTSKNMSFGALYVSLNRLIKYGYLESYVGESSSVRGGKAKRYYRLTKDGILALMNIRRLQRLMWKDFDSLADEWIKT
ncbi:MAG: PadR family transcriptional regulator [Candidatus Aminicenantes bacterium]|jgi:DNA-binding PadR family transcriptional regulator